MKYYIVIPAHNEESFLTDTLHSVLNQTLQAEKVVIVNDNSTDKTEIIIDEFVSKSNIFQKLNHSSSDDHMPGSKVIRAFNFGLGQLDEQYDFIVKLDADCILPNNYFEEIAAIFRNNYKIGIAGGFAYEQDENGEWKLNHTMNKDHVRGAFKAYTKSCFLAIGGLKQAMGWDSVDELLARYHKFEIHTEPNLKVKHLRPIGKAYNKKAKLLQGKAMYTLRYGFLITFIAALKMAFNQKKLSAFIDSINGYLEAKKSKSAFIVNEDEGRFIRKLRWSNIRKRFNT